MFSMEGTEGRHNDCSSFFLLIIPILLVMCAVEVALSLDGEVVLPSANNRILVLLFTFSQPFFPVSFSCFVTA